MSDATTQLASKDLSRPPTEADRVRETIKWILAGHAEPDIVDAIVQKWPKQKTKPLIAKAIQQIAKAGEIDTNLVFGFCFEATREIFRKASEVGDHQTALRALKQLYDLSKK